MGEKFAANPVTGTGSMSVPIATSPGRGGFGPQGARGRPRLICTDGTLDWGADDIDLEISVDGKRFRYINNDEISDMEQDGIRDLDQWISEFVPYRKGIEFRAIELDDIDPNDIDSQALSLHDRLTANEDLFEVSQKNPDGSIRGTLYVNIDDGRYDVQLTLTTWDEQF
jgi:hypothetical protein